METPCLSRRCGREGPGGLPRLRRTPPHALPFRSLTHLDRRHYRRLEQDGVQQEHVRLRTFVTRRARHRGPMRSLLARFSGGAGPLCRPAASCFELRRADWPCGSPARRCEPQANRLWNSFSSRYWTLVVHGPEPIDETRGNYDETPREHEHLGGLERESRLGVAAAVDAVGMGGTASADPSGYGEAHARVTSRPVGPGDLRNASAYASAGATRHPAARPAGPRGHRAIPKGGLGAARAQQPRICRLARAADRTGADVQLGTSCRSPHFMSLGRDAAYPAVR